MKPKTCKSCKRKFTPTRPLQSVCSPRCAIEYANRREQAKLRKEAAQKRKEAKRQRESLKTHREWLKELQTVFNRFIRERDKDKPCISCGRSLAGRKFDAGHYRSVGSAPHLRFNEDNVWGQCVPCNRNLHGNLIEYRKGLVARIGKEAVERLENDNGSGKLSIPEIRDLIRIYKEKLRK